MALRPGQNKTSAERASERKSAQDQVFMREVDDAVRKDQYTDFGRKYGVPLVAVIVLGLVAFGGYLLWNSRQEAAMEQQSETLVSALDQIQAGNLSTGSERLDSLANEGEGGAQTAARMLQAGIALEQGNDAEAVRLFAAIAADEGAPAAMRDLATIREVAARFDTMEPEQVIERLRPLAVPGNPWFGSAGELVALAHLEAGNQDAAGALLAQIAQAEGVPEALRSRTRQLAGLYGVDAIGDVDEVLDEASGPNGPVAAAAGQ